MRFAAERDHAEIEQVDLGLDVMPHGSLRSGQPTLNDFGRLVR